MTVFRRYGFPMSVLALLGVIGINLFAFCSRQAPQDFKGPNGETPHVHAQVKPKTSEATDKEHHAKKPAKNVPTPEGKMDRADHGMLDHKGMMGKGMMGMGMMGKGMMGMMHGNMADMMDIRFLLFNHEKINRTVKRLANGVETVTTSNDGAVAEKIQVHVKAMYERLRKKQVIRPMDPLFAAIFENADKIEIEIATLPNGLRVKETSKDAYAVKLINAHAEVVNRFVQEGMSAMMKMSLAPNRE